MALRIGGVRQGAMAVASCRSRPWHERMRGTPPIARIHLRRLRPRLASCSMKRPPNEWEVVAGRLAFFLTPMPAGFRSHAFGFAGQYEKHACAEYYLKIKSLNIRTILSAARRWAPCDKADFRDERPTTAPRSHKEFGASVYGNCTKTRLKKLPSLIFGD